MTDFELLKTLEGKFLWYVYRVVPRTELVFVEKYIGPHHHQQTVVTFDMFNVTYNKKCIMSIGTTFACHLAQTGETVFTPNDHTEKIIVL